MTLKESCPFNCGDIVREVDGRHEGVVVAVISHEAKVRWENGWTTFFDRKSDLVVVRKAKTTCAKDWLF